jgi:hypothetical protein
MKALYSLLFGVIGDIDWAFLVGFLEIFTVWNFEIISN